MFLEVFGIKLTIMISIIFLIIVSIPSLKLIKSLLNFLKTGEHKQLFNLIIYGTLILVTSFTFSISTYIAVYMYGKLV